MSKRSVFQFRAPRAKMPKLNITISSSQQGPTNNLSPLSDRAVPVAQPRQSEDMWPDDDDDLIMLASQAAEEVEANAEMVLSQAMNQNTTYGQFHLNVQSSTQLDKSKNIIDVFMSEDEEMFAEIPECDIAPKPVLVNNATENGFVPVMEDNMFAEPSTSAATKNQLKMGNAQNTFLSNKLRDQKKEIENLKETLAKINEKCQTKEGEASTLRYELEVNRQQSIRLRKEKMAEIEQLEKGYVEKVTTLEKIVEKHETEIQFKNMELWSKKSKRSLNDTMPPPAVPAERETAMQFKLYNLFRLAIANSIFKPNAKPALIIPAIVNVDFEPNDGLTALGPKDASILQHLIYLQTIYNRIDELKNIRPEAPIVRQIFKLATEFITFLHSYALQLDFGQSQKYDASIEYKQLSQNIRGAIDTNRCRLRCLNDKPCIEGEKLIFERRLLAAISLICSGCPSLTASLLDTAVGINEIANNEAVANGANEAGHETFVDLLAIALTKIAFLKTSNLHKGLIEASSTMLTAMASNYKPTEKRNATLLNLFMAIVYCKPDIVALQQLTKFLDIASNECCNQLCRGKSNEISKFSRLNIIRFSSDTCPLQVYASLLEVIFQPNEPLHSLQDIVDNISMLTQITIGLMTVLRNCFKSSVDWLFRHHNSGSHSICYCYRYLVSATIALLHLCIKYWIDDQKCIDLKTIGTIFKMAAIFLQDNFKLHYEQWVLQLGGTPIKNRLQMVYDSLVFYYDFFRFGNSHLNAIKSIDLRRNILMNEPQRVSPELQARSNPSENNIADNGSVLANTFDQFSIKV